MPAQAITHEILLTRGEGSVAPSSPALFADNISIAAWLFAATSAFLYSQKETSWAIACMTASAVGRVLSLKKTTIEPLRDSVTPSGKKAELSLTLIAHVYYTAATGLTIYQYFSEDDSSRIEFLLTHLWNAVDGLIGFVHLVVSASKNRVMPVKIKSTDVSINETYYADLASMMGYNTPAERVVVYLSGLTNTQMLGVAILDMYHKRRYGVHSQLFFSASMFISGVLAWLNLKKDMNKDHSECLEYLRRWFPSAWATSDIFRQTITRYKVGIFPLVIHSASRRALEPLVGGLPGVIFSRISAEPLSASNKLVVALRQGSIAEELKQMINKAKEIMASSNDSNNAETNEIADGLKRIFAITMKLLSNVQHNRTPALDQQPLFSPLLASVFPSVNGRDHDMEITRLIKRCDETAHELSGLIFPGDNKNTHLMGNAQLSSTMIGPDVLDGREHPVKLGCNVTKQLLSQIGMKLRSLVDGVNQYIRTQMEDSSRHDEPEAKAFDMTREFDQPAADIETGAIHADEWMQEIRCVYLQLILFWVQAFPGIDLDSALFEDRSTDAYSLSHV